MAATSNTTANADADVMDATRAQAQDAARKRTGVPVRASSPTIFSETVDDAADAASDVWEPVAQHYRCALADLVATMQRMDAVDPYTIGSAIERAIDALGESTASLEEPTRA